MLWPILRVDWPSIGVLTPSMFEIYSCISVRSRCPSAPPHQGRNYSSLHYVESNLNLRIPGFSSDETRVSISHASTAGDILLAAGSKGSRVTTATATGGAGGTTKASKGAKGAKGGEVKDRETDARLGRGLRAARIAAVKAARKV
jgi:hypothetical protein